MSFCKQTTPQKVAQTTPEKITRQIQMKSVREKKEWPVHKTAEYINHDERETNMCRRANKREKAMRSNDSCAREKTRKKD